MAWRWPWQSDPTEQRVTEAMARVAETVADRVEAEMAEDMRGYKGLGNDDGSYDLKLSELREIRKKCIGIWRVDGTIGQACNLVRRGAFGRGIDTPKAEDERVQAVVDKFWTDVDNQLAITGREGQVRTINGLLLEGERFLTIHGSPIDSKLKIGAIPCNEIVDVIPHPHNHLRPLLYRRKFRPQSYNFDSGDHTPATEDIVWHYRDWRASDDALADDQAARDLIERASNVQDALVYQLKTNTLGHRGVPEVWRVYDWVRTHAGALSDMATMTKALSMFAWMVKTKARTQTQLDNVANAYRNPPPGPGGVNVTNQAQDASPVNVGTGAQQNHNATAHATELEIIKPFGMGHHWYGDPSTGNLATATAMELPAIWTIEDWQSVFGQLYSDLIDLAIARAQQNGSPRLSRDVPDHVDVNFPDAQPWSPETIALLIQGLVQGVQWGLVTEEEASHQIYQALGTNDISEVMQRQYGDGNDGTSPQPPPPGAANDAAQPGEATSNDMEAAEARAQEAAGGPVSPQVATLERQLARAIQRKVIEPWRRRIRMWLSEQETAPPEGMLGNAIGLHAAPDQQALRDVLAEYHVAIANAAGETAVKRVSRATEASGNSGAVRVWEALRVEGQFRLTNPLLLERLEERGREITGEITDTMLEDLRTVLANEYYKGGNGPRTIAKSLDTIFPATYANRAQTIARTETVAMQGQMLQETYKRNGVEKRQWFAFLDGSTRDEHAEAHGQVRAIDEPFDVGGESLMHPGDGSAENAINCRCDVLPVIGNATDLPEQPWMGE